MFELLFKYPYVVFAHGELVLRSAWPRWALAASILAVALGLAAVLRARRARTPRALGGWRLQLIWLLQTAVAALLLTLLWEPAIAVNELTPQANIVAVLVDDSRSMGMKEGGSTRAQQARAALAAGVMSDLERTFQTRLYRFDTRLQRVDQVAGLGTAAGPATHIGAALAQLLQETASLPLGAVVLLSDGGDNSGAIDRAVIDSLRQRHIPVHTVGFGPEQSERDVEVQAVALAARTLAGSRITATVSVSQRGLAGRRTTLNVRDGSKVLAAREIVLPPDGRVQAEELTFDAGAASPKALQFSVVPLPGEVNRANNTVTQLINVEPGPRRILYFEGEPRWEYKFIRRAAGDDPGLQLVSMLRTTENKIYRQGVKDAVELADGFPQRAEELFGFDALVIGSVDAGYFSAAQQGLIREFVDRRGGGLLLLGGRKALADGVWGGSQLNDLLPVVLPRGTDTFHREHATVSLTPAGEDSMITRLADDRAANLQRWSRLPYLMDYQDPGVPKAGASVLAQMHADGRTLPLLITESYGRGRTAVLATGGTWRWQMSLPLGDNTHAMFWQQLLRWLVEGTHGQVTAGVASATLQDDGRVQLSAEVRDRNYLPAADAQAAAHIIGPGRLIADVTLHPVPGAPGRFQADWFAPAAGVYVAEISAHQGAQQAGADTVAFQRLDGVAENFHTEQNVALLRQLAADTGGRYWRPAQLADLPRSIPYTNSGISVQELKDLWNMPIVFLLLLLMRSAEWLLRRRWGLV